MALHDPAPAALRRRLELAIEHAIALLDRLDADGEDLEDEGEAEPSLGSLNCTDQRGWAMGGADDLEGGDADLEEDHRGLQTVAEWRAEHKRSGMHPGGYEPIGF